MQDPAFWEWVEGLSRMLDAEADARPETIGVPVPMSDPAREERRKGLFRARGAGSTFLVGCLAPFVVGVALAIVTAKWG